MFQLWKLRKQNFFLKMSVITCGSEIFFITDNTCESSSNFVCLFFFVLFCFKQKGERGMGRDGIKEKLPKFSHHFF